LKAVILFSISSSILSPTYQVREILQNKNSNHSTTRLSKLYC